jgi:hypothetical protein
VRLNTRIEFWLLMLHISGFRVSVMVKRRLADVQLQIADAAWRPLGEPLLHLAAWLLLLGAVGIGGAVMS